MTLVELEEDEQFVVVSLRNQGEIRKRLIDMGFVRGALGIVLRKAPLGGPIEVRIGRMLLSLRAIEAMRVEVDKASDDG